jgi:hypothetical protein
MLDPTQSVRSPDECDYAALRAAAADGRIEVAELPD